MTHRIYAITFLVVFGLTALAQAQTFNTLYNFTSGTDGGSPYSAVIQDPAGNLYGTTSSGGANGVGTVFKLDSAGNETVLYSFPYPYGEPMAPLVMDKTGNLYGTTALGGFGYGSVFKIDTAGNETDLYSFTGGSDGCLPMQGLTLDEFGSLYGTTSPSNGYGCSNRYGTIFKIDSAGNFTLLHSFTGGKSDGALPQFGHLTMDKAGNLYGVTTSGGGRGAGVLYELSNNGTFTLLHSFNRGWDGCNPYGSVMQDNAGNLYGTTESCGGRSAGTIWKVSNTGKKTTLHNFALKEKNGCFPWGGVVQDSNSNLYGVTFGCGKPPGRGVLYKLSTSGKFTLLNSFGKPGGTYPIGEVVLTASGTLFGTTTAGGSGKNCGVHGCGTVWSYVP